MLGPVHHHRDFEVADLVRAKRAGRHVVSVCLPARNEAATIGAIVETVVSLAGSGGLVDEVVVVDDGSTDDTAVVAEAAGARVFDAAGVLPDAGPGSG
ncbi:MAG TPA: glycosyltransferase, partial [Acidimicrobiia bacterium]|nr:glycosyltransferase [Acidimicrobiia bacterium]